MNTVASNRAANRSRRQFLKTTVIATGGLLGSGLIVGCAMMPAASAALPPSASAAGAMPNAWVKIGADNTVSIICARSEMGQGVFTSRNTLGRKAMESRASRLRLTVVSVSVPPTM